MNAPQPTDLWRVAALTMMSTSELRALLSAGAASAVPWVRAAAACGVAEAQLRLGRILLEDESGARDEAGAFHLFSAAAQDGDPEALNMLGRCYEHGWGTRADASSAARHYRRAAEAGDAWAQYNLGHLLLDGTGVTRDPAEALHWYRCAACAGHARAMNLVARCYEEGWGVARDCVLARAWYRRSAEGGYFRGAYNYATILAAENCIADAVEWFRRALGGATSQTRGTMLKALQDSAHPAIRALAFELPAHAGTTEGLV